MLPGKGQFAGKMAANDVAVKERDRPGAKLHEKHVEVFGQGGFAGPGQSCHEKRQSLPGARRGGLAQFRCNVRAQIPGRNVQLEFQPPGQFRRGEGRGGARPGQAVGRDVAGRVRVVGHGCGRNGRGRALAGVVTHQGEGGLPGIEQLAGAGKGIGMVGSYQGVAGPEIAVDDRFMEGLARAGGQHGQGEQGELGGISGKGVCRQPGAAHAGKVGRAAGQGVADGAQEQQARPGFAGRLGKGGPVRLGQDAGKTGRPEPTASRVGQSRPGRRPGSGANRCSRDVAAGSGPRPRRPRARG